MSAESEDPRVRPFSVVDRRHSSSERTDDDAEGSPRKPTYVAALEEKLAAAEARAADVLAQYRAAKDEFENARARLSREVALEVERGRRSFLVELIEVVDSMDRAVDAAATATELGTLRHGFGLVRDQLLAKLGQFGVRRGQSLAARFDPSRHEAVTTVPVTDADQDNQVLGVVQEAFFVGDELLRPAQVAVGKLSAAVHSDDPSASAEPAAGEPSGPESRGEGEA